LFGARHEAQPENSVLGSEDLLPAAVHCGAITEFGDFQGQCRSHSRAAARLAKLSETDAARSYGQLGGHWYGGVLLGPDSRLPSLFVERGNAEALSVSVERGNLRIIVVVVLLDHRGGRIEPNDTIVAK